MRRGEPTRNRFIDALPLDVSAALVERCIVEEYGVNDVLGRFGEPVRRVQFPTAGAVSEVQEQRDGSATEIAAIGPEGFSPVEVLLDELGEQRLRIIQVRARALTIAPRDLLELRDRFPALRKLGNRFAAASLRATSIAVGCNARHDATARLARWLLRMHDRAQIDTVELTHDTVALMLAVRRPTVSEAIAVLVERGAIASRRGIVEIVDRARLEEATCPCYAETREVFASVYADVIV
jgi:CRP-like cAMP-binding protein